MPAPPTIAIVPGDNALLARLLQQHSSQPGILHFPTANALLWHARRAPIDTAVIATHLPDMEAADLLEILPLVRPTARLVVCGASSPQLLATLEAAGGTYVPVDRPAEETFEDLYQVLDLSAPAVRVDQASPATPATRLSVTGIMSSRRMAAAEQLLRTLADETGAQFVLLSDAIGMPMLQLGDPPLRGEVVGPLLAPGFYATAELAHQLREDPPQAMYLYEGGRYNLYAFNIAQRALLTLIVDKAQRPASPAPIWMLARQATRQLRQILDS